MTGIPEADVSLDSWGPWKLNVSTLVLECDGYEVDLERCTTSAEALDWIVQVAGKTWATDKVLAGLVRAFKDVLNPQDNLCSGGEHKTITAKDVMFMVRSVTH